MSSLFRGSNSTQAASFGDIGVVARQEKHRLFGDAEPAEVRQARVRAQTEADSVLQRAAEEAAALREAARREGFHAGFAEGRAAGMDEAVRQAARERTQVRAELSAFAEQLDAERRQMWRETETEIIAFVLEVAQKVVKDEARVNRDVALSVIRSSLRRVVEGEHIRIRVNIEDLDTVRSAREELVAILDGLPMIEIVDDRRVGAGGCVIETSTGTLDAKVETQIEEIGAALRLEVEAAA